MAIVFPASPSTNDTFTAGSITYKWDGAKWIGLGVTPADRLVEGSNSLEIDANNDLVYTGPGTLKANSADASGYIAEFNQTNTSNSGQILINSPTDGESRPVLIDMARAGNVQWSLGQGYLDTSDAFHISTTSLASGFANTKLSIDSSGDTTLGKYSAPSTNSAISSQTLNFIGGGWNTNNGPSEVGTKLQSQHAYWTGNYSSAFGQTYPDFKILIKNSDSSTYDEKFAFSGNGVMRLISGGGINFNNYGQGTDITSNLLNDYEHGTWTPTLTGFTNAGTISGRVRDYIKIGKQVTVWFDIFQNSNNMSFANGATITGLPFSTTTFASGDQFHTKVNVQYYRGGGTMVNMTAYVESTDTIIITGASAHSDIRHIWGHVTYPTT